MSGCRVSAGPLTSTTPSSSPVDGWWMGAAVQCLLEVLGGEQLHRGCFGERRPDGVGPYGALGPAGALGEAQRIRAQQDPGRALAPEDHPVGVGDDHDEHRGVGDTAQHLPELPDDQRQGRAPAPGLDVGEGEWLPGIGACGVQAESEDPRPGPRHDASRADRRAAPADDRVMDPLEHPCVL
jgi:hypothetical protein